MIHKYCPHWVGAAPASMPSKKIMLLPLMHYALQSIQNINISIYMVRADVAFVRSFRPMKFPNFSILLEIDA